MACKGTATGAGLSSWMRRRRSKSSWTSGNNSPRRECDHCNGCYARSLWYLRFDSACSSGAITCDGWSRNSGAVWPHSVRGGWRCVNRRPKGGGAEVSRRDKWSGSIGGRQTRHTRVACKRFVRGCWSASSSWSRWQMSGHVVYKNGESNNARRPKSGSNVCMHNASKCWSDRRDCARQFEIAAGGLRSVSDFGPQRPRAARKAGPRSANG
mmetsp:Transcript_50029/g.140259  ORF Transcript_50029/g.140259 Transcript_50029/m.140259 type:complete len:211 (+) Transcript_50029:906-1538(+)